MLPLGVLNAARGLGGADRVAASERRERGAQSRTAVVATRAQRPGVYSGMLPCLRGGRGSRFVIAVRSASISTGRVRRGSITSST